MIWRMRAKCSSPTPCVAFDPPRRSNRCNGTGPLWQASLLWYWGFDAKVVSCIERLVVAGCCRRRRARVVGASLVTNTDSHADRAHDVRSSQRRIVANGREHAQRSEATGSAADLDAMGANHQTRP